LNITWVDREQTLACDDALPFLHVYFTDKAHQARSNLRLLFCNDTARSGGNNGQYGFLHDGNMGCDRGRRRCGLLLFVFFAASAQSKR